ncbi:hypothetical protein BJ878DRAFT_500101 [Calycina marina]|uniref:BZIP domain-containing protein n=1 Tax=Calycina marina TaxID=1763456 RepID=A0A9P7Z5J6_9HELO|nr:hypothetical protein BJ878DRAFT_500101 [Calycina marina]
MVNSNPPEPSDTKRQKPSGSTQKLSDERLARKRALDREAQRTSRCRTKNHIALLESRIEALTRVQDNGNTKELIDQIEQQRLENEALRGRLKSIAKLVIGEELDGTSKKSAFAALKSQTAETDLMPLNCDGDLQFANLKGATGVFSDSIESSSPEYSIEQQFQFIERSDQAPDTMNGSDIDVMCNMPPTAATLEVYNVPNTTPDHPLAVLDRPLWVPRYLCAPATQCKCSKIKNFTSQLLDQCCNLQIQTTANQSFRNADIPIRAVLHGWQAVTRKYLLDPMWSMLRHADEIIFSKCGATERLVVLRNLSLQLRYKVNSTQQNLEAIPSYLHERPSQRHIPHDSLVDFIVWPGLRERFVFTPHLYCNEKFTALFWKCFRFTWDYELCDVYVRDAETGNYMFSKSFNECSWDIGNFCMTNEFLEEFPELRVDVTKSDEEKSMDHNAFENMKGMLGVGELELSDLDMMYSMGSHISAPIYSQDGQPVS